MSRADFLQVIERAEQVLREANVPFTPFVELEWIHLMKEARDLGLQPNDIREWIDSRCPACKETSLQWFGDEFGEGSICTNLRCGYKG